MSVHSNLLSGVILRSPIKRTNFAVNVMSVVNVAKTPRKSTLASTANVSILIL